MNAQSEAPETLENITFDEIQVGDTARLSREVKREDIELFAVVSGDFNPSHLDDEFARSSTLGQVVAHGMLSGAMISAVLGNRFPGPGTVYVSQNLRFGSVVHVGDTLNITLTCLEKIADKQHVRIGCEVMNQNDVIVAQGEAVVAAPTSKIRRLQHALPDVMINDHKRRYEKLIGLAAGLPPVKTAVVHPCDEESLKGALKALHEGLITPVLIGPLAKIQALAEALGASLEGCTLIDTEHSVAAAERAVAMARAGEVDALMKGSLHTDELIKAVLARPELRSPRRLSHVFRFDVPMYLAT